MLVPDPDGLSTADVYAEADRLGLGRDPSKLEEVGAELRRAAAGGDSPLASRELLTNDLARAEVALVTGSGPTAFGLFADIAAADAAAARLGPRFAGAIVAGPDPGR